MTGNTTASFRQGETVTYGSHGVGVVEGLCSEMVAGQEMSLYVLRLQSGQVIKVSTRSAHQNFIPVQKKPQMAAVIAVLCQNPNPRKRVWAHTERDFTSRLGKQDAADLIYQEDAAMVIRKIRQVLEAGKSAGDFALVAGFKPTLYL